MLSDSLLALAVRAPIAWSKATGEGTNVVVVSRSNHGLEVVTQIAPNASVTNRVLETQESWSMLHSEHTDIIAFPDANLDPNLIKVIRELIARQIAVILGNRAFDPENSRELDRAGAIIVGTLRFEQANWILSGDTGKGFPANTYVPGWSGADGPLVTAGIISLLKEEHPQLRPNEIKQTIKQSSTMRWQLTDPATGQRRYFPVNAEGQVAPRRWAFQKPVFFPMIDAPRALGQELAGNWVTEAMNVRQAWRYATGKGVTVAVVDFGFHPDNGDIKDQVIAWETIGSSTRHNHGTQMARVVVGLAPDVSLLLVETSGNHLAQGIERAVELGADVISLSWGAEFNNPQVETAIEQAVNKDVSVVWFNYLGESRSVVKPQWYTERNSVIGVFPWFADDPVHQEARWSISCSAPQTAGLLALGKEVHPNLGASDLKNKLVNSVRPIGNGNLVDALALIN